MSAPRHRSSSAPRFTELTGVRYPDRADGMGWVSGARLTAATAAAGGLGIIASSTMSSRSSRRAIQAVKERTDAPFGVNIRSDAADVGERVDLMIRERRQGRVVRAGPQEGADREAEGRRRRHDAVHRRQAACREGGELGRGRGHGAGR